MDNPFQAMIPAKVIRISSPMIFDLYFFIGEKPCRLIVSSLRNFKKKPGIKRSLAISKHKTGGRITIHLHKSFSLKKWCRLGDLNTRPTHYECVALPTELKRHNY